MAAFRATPLPKVNLKCSATIGGRDASLSYCGEAPGSTAGLVQVNALIPESVTPGSAVPVSINIGVGASQTERDDCREVRGNALRCGFSLLPLWALAVHAQTAPTLAVDASASRHAISPYIYGINAYADDGLAALMHIPLRRFGGDATSSYNWQIDVSNAAADWYFVNGSQTSATPASTAGRLVVQSLSRVRFANGYGKPGHHFADGLAA